MRCKHHYTIKKIIYDYPGDYFDFDSQTKIEKVVFTSKKRAVAERVYYSLLDRYENFGCEYKGIYYPIIQIEFVRDY